MTEAGAAARDQLARAAGRYWVHLDVDVLDEQAFPATDYLMPGGLSRDELTEPDAPAAGQPGAGRGVAGLLQPAKDSGGAGARYLVGLFSGLG